MANGAYLIQNASKGIALVSPGYMKGLGPAEVSIAIGQYGAPIGVTTADWDIHVSINTGGTTADTTRINALPAQIPVTVQGASEAFINSSLGQVIVNSNTNTNFLGASIINRKNEIIARIDATHPA